MKTIFSIYCFVLLFFGGLFITLTQKEGMKMGVSMSKLFLVLGISLTLWGGYFHYNQVNIISRDRSTAISGMQLMMSGILISFYTGYLVRKIRKDNQKSD